jgi:outer membrane protein OmpA-like peptidoglycan-associated protein
MITRFFNSRVFCLALSICIFWSAKAFCITSVTVQGGGMQREISLGMSKTELIETIGAPDQIKSEGLCLYYEVFDVSVFLDHHMRAECIYLGRNFQGWVTKKSGGVAPLRDIFAEFGLPQSTKRLTYTPSVALRTKATVELEAKADQSDIKSFPLEYRGEKILFELYNQGMVMKYKYVLDDEGISFWLDQAKNLYATVIYPPRGERVAEVPAVKEPEKKVEVIPKEKEAAKVKELEMILFDFDKYNIKPEYIPVLNHDVEYLKENSDLLVTIEGHTCSMGTEAYNQRLSEKRAKSVYDYMTQEGVNPSRLTTVGYGESRPIADNKTREGRAKNRRVQFQLRVKP